MAEGQSARKGGSNQMVVVPRLPLVVVNTSAGSFVAHRVFAVH